MQWWQGENAPRIQAGTWGWLIQRYIHDEISSIKRVRSYTRQNYIRTLDRVAAAIGDISIAETDYTMLAGWQSAMEQKGRSVNYIANWFRHFGLALSHGIKLRIPGCLAVKEIRSEMRIKSPPRRSNFMTRDQVNLIVEEADQRGMGYLSLALLFRFEFMLRGVDVYGQWAPADGRKGGLQHNGQFWEDGLTWEMFNRDLTSFKKVISKTRDTLKEPYHFDLTATPEIRKRLMTTPIQERVGPVIIVKDGLPPKYTTVSQAFSRLVKATGLPKGLRISDARSGAITEAQSLVDPMTLRNAAQHTQITTTDIYARGRSEGANKVVRIRGERTKKES